MGEVYLAVDQRLGSAIALKRTFFANDEMLGNAFEREAKILARLRHPVLPKVSDHFSDNGDQYLVMEHISGDDLSKRLEAANKPYPVSWVMFWADQLLDALSYLHSHEPPIIHRDIKPQNLKLTDENHIVLLDFGLSKDSSGNTVASAPGASGSVVGYTPHFASMEQIRGTGTNAKSDLYSLSATLYQLMTNQVPLDALTRADAMLNDKGDPIVPLSELNPEISPAVSNVILKGLEVSMDKRFANASDMQKALRTAHSQMQNQMSAETQVFNVSDLHSTVPPIKDPTAPIAPSEMATRTPTFRPEPINQVDEQPNMDATLQMNADDVPNIPKQADIKTQVLLAGEIFENEPIAEVSADVIPAPAPSPLEATQVIQVDDAAAPEFFTAPVVEIKEEPVAFTNAVAAQPAPSATPIKEPKKKSGSKAFAILGGLAALFILAIGALAGGWYYYTNYYTAAAVTSTPSPSPTATATPSPEPTVETNSNANVAVNSNTAENSNTNSNLSNQNSQTVQPTPSEAPVSPRATPVPTVKDTSTKPVKPVVPKPTPKPKPKDDRTILLQ